MAEVEKYKIQFAEKNEVFIRIGPCTFKRKKLESIPLDGRLYECGGTIYLANGIDMQASFRINKTGEALLIEESIYIKIDDAWYKLGEPDFYEITKLEKGDVFPIEWEPDIVLEGFGKGPFKMDFKG
ncbi:MAG: hypothetical protein R6V23_04510 [Bacteroidales bacterium]